MSPIKVNEIFFSIQGESSKVGLPTTFIRTSGCHLRCQYCDTTYAYHKGDLLEFEQIMAQVQAFPTKHVCLTGGEPLLQSSCYDLMTHLCDKGFQVSLETSGDKSCANVDSRVLKVVDVKTPGSKEKDRFNEDNLKLNPKTTEFKFVICGPEDFIWATTFCKKQNLFERYTVFYSPSHKEVTSFWMAEKMLSEKSPARLQVQLHKYLWPDKDQGY